ncbi:MAG: HAMP domain-containing protein [Desulfobacteraceae bacterium]|nr:HAMP domain-containing protein [Desulfobacteraceae bacterium]
MQTSFFKSISLIPDGFKNASIRIKLIVAYSCLFVVVLLLSNMTLYFLTKKTIERNIESELHNSTTAILNMVQMAANLSIKNHLRTIAIKNKEIITGLYQQTLTGKMTESEAKKRASQILLSQKIGETGYIYCLDLKGVLEVHPKPRLVGKDLSGYPFIQQQLEKKDGYIEYEWQNPGELDKRPKALYMTYFKPWNWIISVSSYREEFKDLISAEDFYESVMDLRFGETGYSYVIDSLGNLIIHHAQPNTNIYDSRDSEGRYFIRQMIQEKNGRIIYPWQNPSETAPREKLVIFSYLPEYDMIVASSSYLEEFYRPLTIIRYIIIASAIIAILLLLPFTMWFGDLIARPLKEAAERFLSAGEGDFSVRMNIQSKDEIGRMAMGFNGFMDRLESYRDELEDLNKNLETRVQERTAELKKALDDVTTLKGMLPICSGCKKIRDDSGYWQQIEAYISKYSDAAFSHGICPECMKKLYPEFCDDDDDDEKPGE